jgi:hypothetical protein
MRSGLSSTKAAARCHAYCLKVRSVSHARAPDRSPVLVHDEEFAACVGWPGPLVLFEPIQRGIGFFDRVVDAAVASIRSRSPWPQG